MDKRHSRSLTRVLAVGCLLAAFALALFVRHASAQSTRPSLFEDGGYCPATQHSCDFTGGTIPYFAPDPFDVGAACDSNFLSYTNNTGGPDDDGNGIDDNSCYGRCDLQGFQSGTYEETCYVTCQSGGDGLGGYAGCLRGAFGVPRGSLTPLGGSGTQPRNTRLISGNIFRSCLAGTVPTAHRPEYDECIAAGGSVTDCCAQIANRFP